MTQVTVDNPLFKTAQTMAKIVGMLLAIDYGRSLVVIG